MSEKLIPQQIVKFETQKDIVVVGDAWGNPKNSAVVLVHGGGQTRSSWGETAKLLASKGWYAIAIDQRGHGDTSWSEDGDYGINIFADDLLSICQQLGSKPAVIGASLGGMAGMMAEGESTEQVFSKLILVDITPQIDRGGVSKILGFMQQNIEEGFATLEEAAEVIASYIPHRPKPKNLDGLRKNLRLGDDGRYRWHWDPAFMKNRESPEETLAVNPIAVAAAKIEIPVLLIRGKLSELVTEEAVEAFMELVPHAEYVNVKDAGHMVAGDQNDIFSEAILEFLDSK